MGPRAHIVELDLRETTPRKNDLGPYAIDLPGDTQQHMWKEDTMYCTSETLVTLVLDIKAEKKGADTDPEVASIRLS